MELDILIKIIKYNYYTLDIERAQDGSDQNISFTYLLPPTWHYVFSLVMHSY